MTIRTASRAVVAARIRTRRAEFASNDHDRDWDRTSAFMEGDWDDRWWSAESGRLAADARSALKAEEAALTSLQALLRGRPHLRS
jgi:hypothetical protein